jgi:hypothetical protein
MNIKREGSPAPLLREKMLVIEERVFAQVMCGSDRKKSAYI